MMACSPAREGCFRMKHLAGSMIHDVTRLSGPSNGAEAVGMTVNGLWKREHR
ncbi:MAG TPA: hypothetical protein VGO91_04525 [Pyrinomonadaceae bacterium]|nr:hypothetical protein [Pyrinomonadaceae bacterium]